MSVVSSDDAPEPLHSPLPLSSLFLTHWPATCSLFLLPITRSSVLCASCYMSMSLVVKNALWLSHVLVYWIKENPNIIVINTKTLQYNVIMLPGVATNVATEGWGVQPVDKTVAEHSGVDGEVFTTTSTREIQLYAWPATQLTCSPLLPADFTCQSIAHARKSKWKGSIVVLHFVNDVYFSVSFICVLLCSERKITLADK